MIKLNSYTSGAHIRIGGAINRIDGAQGAKYSLIPIISAISLALINFFQLEFL